MAGPEQSGSVARYRSATCLAPVTGSGRPSPPSRQPRSSVTGSASVSPMTRSSPRSRRTISARCDHGHARQAYSWYLARWTGNPLDPSLVIRPVNVAGRRTRVPVTAGRLAVAGCSPGSHSAGRWAPDRRPPAGSGVTVLRMPAGRGGPAAGASSVPGGVPAPADPAGRSGGGGGGRSGAGAVTAGGMGAGGQGGPAAGWLAAQGGLAAGWLAAQGGPAAGWLVSQGGAPRTIRLRAAGSGGWCPDSGVSDIGASSPVPGSRGIMSKQSTFSERHGRSAIDVR